MAFVDGVVLDDPAIPPRPVRERAADRLARRRARARTCGRPARDRARRPRVARAVRGPPAQALAPPVARLADARAAFRRAAGRSPGGGRARAARAHARPRRLSPAQRDRRARRRGDPRDRGLGAVHARRPARRPRRPAGLLAAGRRRRPAGCCRAAPARLPAARRGGPAVRRADGPRPRRAAVLARARPVEDRDHLRGRAPPSARGRAQRGADRHPAGARRRGPRSRAAEALL